MVQSRSDKSQNARGVNAGGVIQYSAGQKNQHALPQTDDQLRSRAAAEKLIHEYWSDHAIDDRPRILTLLINLAEPTAAPFLGRLLNVVHDEIWQLAVTGLVNIGTSDALTLLENARFRCANGTVLCDQRLVWFEQAIAFISVSAGQSGS